MPEKYVYVRVPSAGGGFTSVKVPSYMATIDGGGMYQINQDYYPEIYNLARSQQPQAFKDAGDNPLNWIIAGPALGGVRLLKTLASSQPKSTEIVPQNRTLSEVPSSNRQQIMTANDLWGQIFPAAQQVTEGIARALTMPYTMQSQMVSSLAPVTSVMSRRSKRARRSNQGQPSANPPAANPPANPPAGAQPAPPPAQPAPQPAPAQPAPAQPAAPSTAQPAGGSTTTGGSAPNPNNKKDSEFKKVARNIGKGYKTIGKGFMYTAGAVPVAATVVGLYNWLKPKPTTGDSIVQVNLKRIEELNKMSRALDLQQQADSLYKAMENRISQQGTQQSTQQRNFSATPVDSGYIFDPNSDIINLDE